MPIHHDLLLTTVLFKKTVPLKDLTRCNLYLFFTVFSFGLLSYCTEAPPTEEQIRVKTDNAKLAIENLNPDQLEDILAPDFEISADNKKYDLDLIQKTMKLYAFKKQKINVTLGPLQIETDPYNTQLASMKTTALVTGGRGMLPEDGRIYNVKTKWRLFDEQWLITNLTWE